MGGLFNWYKNSNIIIKIVLFVIPLLMFLLWLLGSFTKIDRLIMFTIGLIVGGLLINIFLGEYITIAVDWIVETVYVIFN